MEVKSRDIEALAERIRRISSLLSNTTAVNLLLIFSLWKTNLIGHYEEREDKEERTRIVKSFLPILSRIRWRTPREEHPKDFEQDIEKLILRFLDDNAISSVRHQFSPILLRRVLEDLIEENIVDPKREGSPLGVKGEKLSRFLSLVIAGEFSRATERVLNNIFEEERPRLMESVVPVESAYISHSVEKFAFLLTDSPEARLRKTLDTTANSMKIFLNLLHEVLRKSEKAPSIFNSIHSPIPRMEDLVRVFEAYSKEPEARILASIMFSEENLFELNLDDFLEELKKSLTLGEEERFFVRMDGAFFPLAVSLFLEEFEISSKTLRNILSEKGVSMPDSTFYKSLARMVEKGALKETSPNVYRFTRAGGFAYAMLRALVEIPRQDFESMKSQKRLDW